MEDEEKTRERLIDELAELTSEQAAVGIAHTVPGESR